MFKSISWMTFITALCWKSVWGWETSRTCTSTSAWWTYARVARKEATRAWGRFVMKPTVSIIRQFWLVDLRWRPRWVVSRVSKSLFSEGRSTPAHRLSNAVLPALV